MNRPAALNALDVPTARAFLAACQSLASDPELRVVVLRGEGKGFGAGGDVAALQADPTATAHELIACLHEAVLLLTRLDAPVLASLHGVVAGGSLSLAMACDLAIAAESMRFNLAYANLGASCDLSGFWHLPRLVGLRNAMQIALLSDTFDAAEALRLGLVNRVVPDAQLHVETLALARRLAAGPTCAYGHIKRLLRQSHNELLNDKALDLCADGGAEKFVLDGDNSYGGRFGCAAGAGTQPRPGWGLRGHAVRARLACKNTLKNQRSVWTLIDTRSRLGVMNPSPG